MADKLLQLRPIPDQFYSHNFSVDYSPILLIIVIFSVSDIVYQQSSVGIYHQHMLHLKPE